MLGGIAGRLVSGIALIGALSSFPTMAAQVPATFTPQREAKAHCPTDIVVWLNLPTGVHHFAGQRWYGNTKSGAYVCRKEADTAGDRATPNGQ